MSSSALDSDPKRAREVFALDGDPFRIECTIGKYGREGADEQ
jgi:hypothetical protein